ncbi:MAG: hypothetical protein DME19_05400 [Verrucomicrobia bacterium]|nr:MAG: hypothetical protein DME19_05400 [Verrucomicrobiota bacterium]
MKPNPERIHCNREGLSAILFVFVCATQMMPVRSDETPTVQTGRVPQAPPTAPPVEVRAPVPQRPSPRRQGPSLYSIGDPTDEEQLYLEYINRSRANPSAEGVRLANTTDPDVLSAYAYFSVDLTLMQNEFATNPPVPPLAFNSKAIDAARWHSGDMLTNMYQAHNQTNDGVVRDPGQRLNYKGYTWNTYGENIYAYAENVLHGHAGLNVDWGPGVGGMQNPPGHRNNIHNGNFREAGIGVVDGVNGSVGPQLVTQDFATQPGATPFITGVAYYDFNTNSFYDLGEGVGGVTVDVSVSSYHAVTANSGGYAVPVPGNGTYTVTFTAPGLATNQQQVTVSTLKNVKVDYVPAYSPPLISGPNPAGINQSNTYTFTPVGAATGYQWEQTQIVPFTTVEGAETGLANVTAVTSLGYSVIDGSIKFAGNNSFHLAHPSPPTDQFLTLNYTLRPGAGSQLTFYSQLSWANSTQVARAQVSTDNGSTWQDVWSQAGTGGSGESVFTQRAVSLGSYAGQQIKIRFMYDFTGGQFFPQTDGVGFYIDNISVTGADQLSNPFVADIPTGTSFVFYPTNTGDYSSRVRAQVSNRYLDWGPIVRVTASVITPATVQFSTPAVSGNQAQIDFDVTNYRTDMVFQLLQASDVAGAWTTNSSASFTNVTGSTFRLTTSIGGAGRMFYRLQAN